MMSQTQEAEIVFITRQRVLISLALMVLLSAVYLLTYTGRMEIGDELQYFDATGSMARFGDRSLDISLWQWVPTEFAWEGPSPLRDTIVDPAFTYATAPLFWLAERVEGFGLVHTTWLFNIFFTPLVAVLMFWYGIALGWRDLIAVWGALALGLLTVLFPYSHTFFREQLMLSFILIAMISLERWHQIGGVWRWLLIALALLGAYLTKDALLFALPGIALLSLPARFWRVPAVKWLALGSGVLAALLALVIAYTGVFSLFDGITFLGKFTLESELTQTALHTYLFSIGGSFWGTSPIVLLALPGIVLLWKKTDYRVLFGAVFVIFSYIFAYGILRGEGWFGGTIWPQRFLIPVLPFAMVLCLPVFDALNPQDKGTRHTTIFRLSWLAVGILALYSLWWQLSGVAFNWYAYGRATYDLSFGGLVYWSPGFNVLEYIRPVVLAGTIGTEPLNFAWARTEVYWIPLVFGAVAVLMTFLLWRVMRQAQGWHVLAIIASPFAMLMLTALMLWSLYPTDELYLASRDDLHAMVDIIREELDDGDVLLLNNRDYVDFFYNYGKVGRVRTVTLPYHPGDRGSCEQELQVTSDIPGELIAPGIAPIVRNFANNHERLWVLMSTGPEIPCVVRPFERWLGEQYYLISETRTAPQARLLEYSTVRSPERQQADRVPPINDLAFSFTAENGDQVALIGYALPEGDTIEQGGTFNLSTLWQVNQTPVDDYTVAWFLVNEQGAVVAEGNNSWHGATFKPTTTMPADEPVWDHRALNVPDDLPAGDYGVWMRLYYYNPDNGEIQLLDVEAGNDNTGEIITLPDGKIAQLPIRLHLDE